MFYIKIPPSFEWDEAKEQTNLEKHSVSFRQAQLAFLDKHRVIAEDIKHSNNEPRYYCFGKVENRIMTVRFTWRKNVIRIIGASYWLKGEKIYEKENTEKKM